VSQIRAAHTKSTVKSWLQSFLLSLAAVFVSACASVVFSSLAREEPFLFFIPAVFFSLWIGGFRISIVSCVLSAVAIDFFLLPPYYHFALSRSELGKEVLFLLAMSGAAWVFDRHRQRIERSQRLQQKLLEGATESIYFTNAENRVAYWNRGAEQLYGWTAEEAIGKIPNEFLQTCLPEPRESIHRQLKEHGHWHGQLVRKAKDGRSVITDSSWTLDEETGFTLRIDLDVTEQSRVETELKRVNRALGALSKVNHVLLHATNESELLEQAVNVIVHEGNYPLAWVAIRNDDPECSIRVGAAAGRAIAYISKMALTWSDEPLGRGATGTALREGRIVVNPDFLGDQNYAPWREFALQHGCRSSIHVPLVVQGKTYAALNIYAAEENAFEGQEFSLASELASNLAFALTSLRLREQAEEERYSRMQVEGQLLQAQKMEAIGRLAGGISHDFNNLLMVIMAQTELLSLQLSGTALARAENVMASAKRAAELTQQLLAFSRKQITQPKVLTLNTVLSDIAEMATHLVGEDIEIATRLCNEPWPVMADRSQIEQVIMNLIVNARDAMPNGGKLTLETHNMEITTEYIATHPLVPPGRYFMMAVSDTGVGIDEATQAHMFEPFFTTKEFGKGTGLGLSMVYGIVKQAGGFVWFYSELGVGTCFKIYLPAAELAESSEVLLATPLSSPASTHEAATILLVEDEPALREVVTSFLESGGHTVIAAESHEEALKRAAEDGTKIDVLLTDVVLKGRNGKQLADSLYEKGFRFKVIYMSGYTPDAIVHHGVLEEGTLFLQKPFSRNALLAKIQGALSL